MNNYEKLEGMVAATFTPLDENGDVNLSVIDKYADWIASTPIKGVFVCGSFVFGSWLFRVRQYGYFEYRQCRSGIGNLRACIFVEFFT